MRFFDEFLQLYYSLFFSVVKASGRLLELVTKLSVAERVPLEMGPIGLRRSVLSESIRD